MEIRKRHVVGMQRAEKVYVVLAGCGGTGSFLALHLARIAWDARERYGLDLRMRFVDPDRVERGNIGRQNFCPAEVGEPKAWCLMQRYNAAFGLNIEARVECLDYEHMMDEDGYWYRGPVVVGAVDGVAGRQVMQSAVRNRQGMLWWLDCGNHDQSGQVLIGNRTNLRQPEISPMGFCSGLPSPGTQHPELLEAPAPAAPVLVGESCAELTAAGVQGLMVNQAVAGWAATYLARLLVSRDLDVYATYFDLVSGSTRSLGIEE